MIRARIAEDGGASTAEYIDVERPTVAVVQVGVMPGREHALALCILELAQHKAIDVHTFVAALAQEIRR